VPSSLDPEFDAFARDYDAALDRGLALSGERKEYFAGARIGWLRDRLKDLGVTPRSALDFGCGTGTSCPLLLQVDGVESVLGADVSEQSIDVARRLHGSDQVRFGLIDELPRDGFDLAFCNGVFHHIPPDERGAALSSIRASLRPGGLFALFENNPLNPGTRLIMSRIPFDRNAITLRPGESRRMLREAGFDVLRTDFLFFFPRVLAALRPLEPSLSKIPLGAQYLCLVRKTS
jgi:SAM-dependent methyltransferase